MNNVLDVAMASLNLWDINNEIDKITSSVFFFFKLFNFLTFLIPYFILGKKIK